MGNKNMVRVESSNPDFQTDKKMTREEARNITLRQFLYYMDDQDVFQLNFTGDEWDDYVELTRRSMLLKPFKDCRIDCLGVEGGTIRICVERNDSED